MQAARGRGVRLANKKRKRREMYGVDLSLSESGVFVMIL